MSILSVLDNLSFQKKLVKTFFEKKSFVFAVSIELLEKFLSDNEIEFCCVTEIKSLEHAVVKFIGFKLFHQKKAN